MAWTAPDVVIFAVHDRWAYQKQAAIHVCVGGTDVWTRVDASGNETFENRCETARTTALDAAFEQMMLGDFAEMGDFLRDVNIYAVTDLSHASFDAYLTDSRCRLDLRAAQIWQEQFGASALTVANIASRGDGGPNAPGLSLGTITSDGAGGTSLVAGTDMSETTNGPSPILARKTTEVAGGTGWDMTVTCKHATGITPTTEAIVIAMTDGVDEIVIVGEELMAGGEAVGQTVIELAATDQFAVGQEVLLTQWTGNAPDRVWDQQETATISEIALNTSITLTAPIRNTYTATARTFVYPCFIGVASVAAGAADSDNGDIVTFYPAPDRALKL